MSLSDPLWSPTSVQVTVLQARGLRIKGKSGTNDAYAVMQVGKEKYQTSVAEKCVAPMWKEEASFDLPLAHQGGTERGTLHVHVLHRALVGPDKLLGQAVINLLQLCEDKTRDKTQWFKLLDKTGKPDKDRGEVLVDIQFTRNNMTASMFDISTAGKSRSRLGKFKDKIRGKKRDGLSETESNVVPSVTQVLTDSDGNSDGEEAAGKDEEKKKVKSLFSHKSNLQKSLSQSMNVLPGKNSSLSGSLSSGLNMESSEGKKKFKFMMHKRTGSSDKKDGQQKLAPEQSNLCINGSHVYCDEPPPRTSRTGSSFSLASSGVGSMEDVPESSPPSVGSNHSVRRHSPWTEEEGETGKDAKQEVDEDGELFRRQELEKLAEEESRKEKEQRRIEQEKHEEQLKIEKEEEERRLQEERREKEEEERRRAEEVRIEQERLKKEEERKQAAEKIRLEEVRKLQEKEEREQRELEKRKKEEEEMRRMMELEQQRREELEKLEKERMRMEKEEQKRREEEEKKQKAEEEERAREKKRVEQEEKAKKEIQERQLEEERRQKELMEEQARIRKEEERLRMEMERAEEEQRNEEERQLEEERKRLEEEEKKQIAEEEKRRREREEEMLREEEERVRREKEEEKRLMEEERRREQLKEEQERIRKEEKMRLEKQRAEEERKKREEERVIKEREEYERMLEEKRKQTEKEERKRMEEEEKQRREEAVQMAEEKRRQEEERKRRIEVEERVVTVEALRRNKTTLETQDSTNPFDEEDAPERNASVRLRCKLPLESNTCSYGEKDLSTTHQEKRQAPKPPRMNSSERRREAQHEAKGNEPSKEKEVKTASVLPQRAVLRISPTSASCVHPKSNTQPEHIPSTARAHNQGKRPAPQRPGSVEEEQLTTKGKISHLPVPESKQTPAVYGLNPFEDEDTDEPTDEDTTTTTATPTSVQETTPKDTVSQIKIKSSKAAQAPVPPAKKPHTSSNSVKQSPDGGPSVSLSDTTAPAQETSHEEPPSVKEEAGKKDAPLVPSRRLQPVRPLNPLDQQPVSAVQGEPDNKSTGGILNGQGQAKASGTGPYALLTQGELISLVLKQESQLSEKNQKISELEQYIDNLLVRVIDEAPGILMTLASVK